MKVTVYVLHLLLITISFRLSDLFSCVPSSKSLKKKPVGGSTAEQIPGKTEVKLESPHGKYKKECKNHEKSLHEEVNKYVSLKYYVGNESPDELQAKRDKIRAFSRSPQNPYISIEERLKEVDKIVECLSVANLRDILDQNFKEGQVLGYAFSLTLTVEPFNKSLFYAEHLTVWEKKTVFLESKTGASIRNNSDRQARCLGVILSLQKRKKDILKHLMLPKK